MPKVSVVMPVYNTPVSYLELAIHSILRQTFRDFEFLIIDDGSTNPATVNCIKSFTDTRIKYIQKEHSGIVDTLNMGLDMATGEYVARMDSDDISLSNRFEKQVKFLDENPDISVVGSQIVLIPNNTIMRFPTKPGILDFLKMNVISHPTVMLRRADFEKHQLRYNPEYADAEDLELWGRTVGFLKYANINEILLHFRMHGGSVTQVRRINSNNVAYRVQQEILARLTDNFELQHQIHNLVKQSVPPTKIFYLFNFIPLLKIKSTYIASHGYLFGFLPIFKIKKTHPNQ